MAVVDVALTARARGLATHLLARDALEALTAVPDLETLARRLASLGALPERARGVGDVFDVERAVAQAAGDRLRTLSRWPRRPRGALDVFFADEDRRSLRALLRGAIQGAPGGSRLRGLLPTPALPAQVLALLSTAASTQEVLQALLARGFPDAERLLAVAGHTAAGLFGLETVLLRWFARRAARAAARDRVLRAFVVETIDVGNAINAWLFAGDPRDVHPREFFVSGGRWLALDAFTAAAASRDRQAAAQTLATALARSPLARVIAVPGAASHIERAFLGAALDRLRRTARREPLGSAPALRVLLLIGAQARDLRALAWGAALGLPSAMRVGELVTPS